MHKYFIFIKRLKGIFPIKRFLKLVFNILDTDVLPFLNFAPPGHYYSPIPTLRDSNRYDILLDLKMREFSGVNLCDEDQANLLNDFVPFYKQLPFSDQDIKKTRYFFDNTWFKAGDAIVLYCMLRHYRPKRIIEVGSGFSSAVMLDVNELFLNDSVKFTFIEPNPDRLLNLLRKSDLRNTQIIKTHVQQVTLSLFHELEEGDVLFIDSSHVAKLGSDVNFIFFNILQQLKPGVLIHFHDVRWPFEYPQSAIEMGIAWNEAYFLRSFLQFNETFKILFFNDYMAKVHADIMQNYMPKFMDWPGASIWLKRIK